MKYSKDYRHLNLRDTKVPWLWKGQGNSFSRTSANGCVWNLRLLSNIVGTSMNFLKKMSDGQSISFGWIIHWRLITSQSAITCSKLTMEKLEQGVKYVCQWCRSGVFIVNFEHISYLVLAFLLLTLSRYMRTGLILRFAYWKIDVQIWDNCCLNLGVRRTE